MNANPYRHYNHQVMGDVTSHHHLQSQHYNEHQYIPSVLPHSWDGGSPIHNHYQANSHSHPMSQYHQNHNYFSQPSWTHEYAAHQGWGGGGAVGGVSYAYPRAYENAPTPQLHYNYQRYIGEYSRYPGYAWPSARDLNRCDDIVTGY